MRCGSSRSCRSMNWEAARSWGRNYFFFGFRFENYSAAGRGDKSGMVHSVHLGTGHVMGEKFESVTVYAVYITNRRI